MGVNISARDEALLRRNFSVADPRTLENLRPGVPSPGEFPVVEFDYDVTPPKSATDRKPDVWCAHCQRLNHWRGYVMLNKDGTRFLCGKDCGLKLYGIEFRKIERIFTHQKDRQYELRRLQRALPAFPPFIAKLRSLKGHASYRHLAELRNRIEGSMDMLNDSLVKAAKQVAPWLTRTERVRDHQAEDARSARNEARKRQRVGMSEREVSKARYYGDIERMEDEKEHIYKLEPQPVLQLRGAILFRKPILSLTEMFETRGADMLAIYKQFNERDSDSLKEKEMVGAFKKLDDILRSVRSRIDEIAAAAHFFEVNHIRSLAAWASENLSRTGKYREVQGALVFLPNDADDFEIRWPSDLILPDAGFVDEFERLIS